MKVTKKTSEQGGPAPKLSARSGLKARRQAFVQDEILAAAASLFAERGYRAVRIDDIGSSLGFTKSVVYYYFSSKNEILWQIFLRIYESYLAGISEICAQGLPPEKSMGLIIKRHALNVMEKREWTAIHTREERELSAEQRRELAQKKRQYDEMIRGIYDEGAASGAFRRIPAHVATYGMLGVCNWLHVWYRARGKYSAEQIATWCATLLSTGYGAAP